MTPMKDTVFRCRMQRDDETVDEYITALRKLIKTCNVCGHMQDEFLKDQIIFGLIDSTTREKLPQERPLALNKCLDMCRAAESATKQAKEIAAGAKAEVNCINFNHRGCASSKFSGYRPRSGPVGQRQMNASPQASWTNRI